MANTTQSLATFGSGPLNYGQDFISQAQAGVAANQAFNTKAGTLSYTQIKDLWIRNGGDPAWAPLMAGIALAESGGNTSSWNKTPPDNSVGLWQVNYYGNLLAPRTASYGSPLALSNDPNLQAKAAIDILGQNGAGIGAWRGDPTYIAWSAMGSPKAPSDLMVSQMLASKGINPGGDGGNAGGTQNPNATTKVPGTCNDGKDYVINYLGLHFGTSCQLKALTGGLLIGVGGVILLTGAVLLAQYGLKNSQVGKAATKAVTSFTPVGRAASAVSGAIPTRGNRQAARDTEQYENYVRERPNINKRNAKERARRARASDYAGPDTTMAGQYEAF